MPIVIYNRSNSWKCFYFKIKRYLLAIHRVKHDEFTLKGKLYKQHPYVLLKLGLNKKRSIIDVKIIFFTQIIYEVDFFVVLE